MKPMKATASQFQKITSKPYGRQAKGKTIRSLSLDAEVAEAAEKQAALLGMSFSKYVNEFLASLHPKSK